MKLRGAAKDAFLARMAAGRARARRNPKRVTKRELEKAAAALQSARSLSAGGHDEAVLRALMRYQELEAKVAAQRAGRRRNQLDPYEEQQRFETEQYMRSKLGENFGKRRKPRVRAVKGRSGMFQCLTDDKRTKRAAFRAARQLRDRPPRERRPLKVIPKRTPPRRKTKPYCAGVRRAARQNPQLLTITNPNDLKAAVRAYRQFHGIAPRRAVKIGKGGGVLVALGELREIVYQPRRGERQGPAFFHDFKPGNVLAVSADGRHLVIVDRRRRKAVDFDRGIVS